MTGLTYLMRVGLLAAVALGAAPAFAVAQDRVPTREGNIWDRNDQQEKATGEIESLYRQLMANEANR
jgi:hypothetical protein